jgi:glycerol-3-phosphate acyltransferase PlsY
MAWMVVAAVLGRVPVVYAAFGLALAGLIFFRHISNLRRILAGTERRVRWPWSQSA